MKSTSLQVIGKMKDANHDLLSNEAMSFVGKLVMHFEERRKQLLKRRDYRQEMINKGMLPDFLPESEHIRKSKWKVDPVPKDLQDRRVEITGPVDRKMIINALNSGAKVFMADFEDAHSPTWEGTIDGQINLYDAVRRTITHTNLDGKRYKLKDQVATLMVRPRGWHLTEKHVLANGEPISASLFDFGLFFYHNAQELIDQDSGPYFYLPKLESHLEARLWNDIFVYAQNELNIPQGTIKATVLIETILAAFEMDEILYELKEHSAGLNCGRWDYIFSYLKRLRNHQNYILPDRDSVTMTVPFMRAYSLKCIQTCHRRGIHAMGGMAAQIPVKDDKEANELAFEKVRADKEREVKDGHDGTWVAHPALVPIAMEVFNENMPQSNQIEKKREDVHVTASDLLEVPKGYITEKGLRTNISVAIQYIEAWLRGRGAVPLNHLMEDAATAEISRAQVWQWIHHSKGILDDGRKVTNKLCQIILEEEIERIYQDLKDSDIKQMKFKEAVSLFKKLTFEQHFEEFLTISAYKLI